MILDLERTAPAAVTPAAGDRRTAEVSVLHSWREPAPVLDPVALFRLGRLRAERCCFWEQSAEDLVMVGVGVAHQIETSGSGRFRDAQQEWQTLVERASTQGGDAVAPRVLGGFAFDDGHGPSERWSGFPAGLLILPRLLYTRHGDAAWFTGSAVCPPGAAAATARRGLHDAWASFMAEAARAGVEGRRLPAASSGMGDGSLEERPDARTWMRLVADAARDIRTQRRSGASDTRTAGSGGDSALAAPETADQHVAGRVLEKVVLARELRVRAPYAFDPAATLAGLRTAGPSRFLFAFSAGQRCFLGATPERLVRLQDGQVETAAVAGSCPRGRSAAEDEELAQALLRSAKDRWEHAVVAREIAEALRTAGVRLPPTLHPTVMRLGTVQHLHTPFVGPAPDSTTVLELVERLHPTPAVGGSPRCASLSWIRAREGLDRGWYAGPVGWVDAHNGGDFAVAIRSALLCGSEASLFAGCGLVGDSNPEAEYAESRLKLRPMLAALGRQ